MSKNLSLKKEENEIISSRNKILDIAFELFASQGFSATSIRQIASAADVNIASIGYYFGGKEGLYREVIKSHLKDFSDAFMSRSSNEKDIKVRIKLFSEMLVHSLSESPSILNIITRELVKDEQDFPSLIGDLMISFTDIFASFFDKTDFPKPESVDTNTGVFDIFMVVAPVYFYYISRKLIDDNILIDKEEIQLFREKLIQETNKRGLKILEKLTAKSEKIN